MATRKKPTTHGPAAAVVAAYYGRVSTAEQVEGTSLGTQRDRCRSAIEARSWNFADPWEYVDEGVSGAKGSRPALDRLMTACRVGSVTAVVVAKLDRFGRSMRHLSTMLGELDDLGVIFVSVAESFDSSTPSGRLQRNMLGSFAEFERDQIRERTMTGLRAVAAEGYWPGGPPPYGYRLVPSGNHTEAQIDPVESEVLLTAIRLIADDGLTTWEAAATLNALGYRPRKSPKWTHHNLRRLLLDARVSGEWAYGRGSGWGRADRPGTVPGKIPPLISSERHARLRAALAATSTGPRADEDSFYLLSKGILISACGDTMHGVFRRDRGSRHYRCNSSRPESTDRCDCHRIPADDVEALVWAEVTKLLSQPAQLIALASEYLAARSTQIDDERTEAEWVLREIAELETARVDRAAEALRVGLDPQLILGAVSQIDEQLRQLRARQQQLEAWRAHTSAASDGMQRIVRLAEQAHCRLGLLAPREQRTVLDVLRLKVYVEGWDDCTACGGRGKLSGGTGGTPCPDCRMTRHLPRIRIEGTWTTALRDSLGLAEYVGEQSDAASRPFRCS